MVFTSFSDAQNDKDCTEANEQQGRGEGDRRRRSCQQENSPKHDDHKAKADDRCSIRNAKDRAVTPASVRLRGIFFTWLHIPSGTSLVLPYQ